MRISAPPSWTLVPVVHPVLVVGPGKRGTTGRYWRAPSSRSGACGSGRGSGNVPPRSRNHPSKSSLIVTGGRGGWSGFHDHRLLELQSCCTSRSLVR